MPTEPEQWAKTGLAILLADCPPRNLMQDVCSYQLALLNMPRPLFRSSVTCEVTDGGFFPWLTKDVVDGIINSEPNYTTHN